MGYIQVASWVSSGQRQASAIRVAYFRALLRQEIGWYDQHSSGALSTQIAESLPKIQEAMSDKVSKSSSGLITTYTLTKVSSAFQFLAMFVVGLIVAFCYNWKLTLVRQYAKIQPHAW